MGKLEDEAKSPSRGGDEAAMGRTYSVSEINSEREQLDEARAAKLLEPLMRAARQGEPVRSVSLSGKSFAPDAACIAREALAGVVKSLRKLDLSDIIAGLPEAAAKETLEAICGAFEGPGHLEEIDVSDNALGKKGMVLLEPLLRGQSALKHVYFCNNGLASDAATLLVDFMAESCRLETLHFHNNLLEAAGAKVLSSLVAKLNSLKSFRFSTTRCTASGIEALSEALLSSAASLRHVEFTDNTVSPEGARAVARLIRATSSLKSLRLRDCSLDNQGASDILKSLSNLEDVRITELDLSGNELTEDYGVEIGSLLAKLSSLERIWLEDNELGDGAVEVVKGLTSSILKEVGLSCCEIGSRAGVKIARILHGKRVQKISLDGNFLSESAVEKVQEILGDAVGTLSDNEGDSEDLDGEEAEGEETFRNGGAEKPDVDVDELAEEIGKKLNL